jgi:tight adherence protein B
LSDVGVTGRLSVRRAALGVTAQTELGDVIALMAGPVQIGVPPATALRAAVTAMPAGGPLQPLFDDLLDAGARGESIAAVWLRHADQRRNADLRFVGQAWGLSEVTGAPLASALQTAEQVLRGRQRSRQRLATAVAGPRASMAVLALLPLCGPLVGLAFGVSPRALYLSSGAAMASVGTGVLMGVLAWWWSRHIIAGATRPSRRRGGQPG